MTTEAIGTFNVEQKIMCIDNKLLEFDNCIVVK